MRFPNAVLPALALVLVAALTACVAAATHDDRTAELVEVEGDGLAAPAQRTEPPVTAAPTTAPQAAAAPADPLALPAEGPPVVPDDVAAIAELLTSAEQAIRDPARPPEDLAAAGHWQQVAYRKLGQRPQWVEPVLAAMPPELHAVVRANVFAGERLAAMHSPAEPGEPVEPRSLPQWRIVSPPSADELKAYYQEAEAATGVHWTYLAAVNLVETRMGRIRGDSVAGAQGPMQFMPATWAEWGEGDVQDHRDAIMAAGRYLRWGGMPSDVNGALFRYNRDVRYVDAVRTYAEQMQADPRSYYGYYHWQVYYFTRVEHVWLPVGYDATGG